MGSLTRILQLSNKQVVSYKYQDLVLGFGVIHYNTYHGFID